MTKNKIWSVSKLNRAVKDTFESCFPYGLWVKGEVSNLTLHRSGHVYLTLKDVRSQVSATWFNGAKQAESLKLKNGDEIECFGQLTVYEPRGNYQINIQKVVPVGAGDLQRKFEELKLKLQTQGLFDPQLKKPIPAMPKCVGVITSPTGAALGDFLNVINRRFSDMHVKIIPATMQGEKVERSVVFGLNYFNKTESCDVIVVTRGGGSAEDLWWFNSEKIAHAIARSSIPVISAIGHDIDYTIPDFVADLRVPTPSAAAELVCGKKTELMNKVKNAKQRLISAIKLELQHNKHRLAQLKGSPALLNNRHVLEMNRQKLDELSLRLEASINSCLYDQQVKLDRIKSDLTLYNPQKKVEVVREKLSNLEKLFYTTAQHKLSLQRNHLENLCSNLNAFNPERVLERGYAMITTADGRVIRSQDQVEPDQQLDVKLAKGQLSVKVLEKE